MISRIYEPRGAFTCRSSTLVVFVDSDPFRGLLLTVLGSESDFKIDEPRGAFTCRLSALAVLADFGLFRGLLVIVSGSRSYFLD